MEVSISENIEEIISCLKKIPLTKNCDITEEEKIAQSYSLLVEACTLKPLKKSEDVPYDEKDFTSAALNSLPYLKCIQRILEELIELTNYVKSFQPKTIKTLLMGSILLAAQFQNAECFWSSQECSDISHQIVESVQKISNSSHFEEVLVGQAGSNTFFHLMFPQGLLKSFMSEFSQKVTKITWKKYPSQIELYLWVLFKIKSPYLSGYLPYFIPPALFILDDWEERHKIMGIRSLHHILQNTPSSELRWYGRAEVIYEALKHHQLTREESLLEHVYPALILAASVVENDPQSTTIMKKSKLDAILDHLLREMAFEEKLHLRSIYAKALKLVTAAMGIRIIKWSDKVLDVCSNYLATHEGEKTQDRLLVLETLQIYIRSCWPRVHSHADRILRMIFKLAYEVSAEGSDVINKDLLLLRSKEVVELLFAAAPVTVTELCRGMEDLTVPNKDSILYLVTAVL